MAFQILKYKTYSQGPKGSVGEPGFIGPPGPQG
jgi:hypothetical protein